MAKRKKTIVVYKIEMTPSRAQRGGATSNGKKYHSTGFDNEERIIEEVKYNDDEEIDEKIVYRYDTNGFICEEKSYFEGEEVTDHITYERDIDGKILKSFRHYQDGSVDTIDYHYNSEGQLTEKITIDSYDEVEAKEISVYNGKSLVQREFFEYDELVRKEQFQYDDMENAVVHHIWTSDDGERLYKNTFENNNLVKSLQYNGKGALIGKMLYVYNDKNKVIEAIEETSKGVTTTRITYDDNGNAFEQIETGNSGEINSRVLRSYNQNNEVEQSEVFINFHGKNVDQHYMLRYEYTWLD